MGWLVGLPLGLFRLLGSILLVALRFAVPMILGDLLQQCYNIADTLVVGRFIGTNALAAVGSVGSLNNMIISLFVGLSIGVNVLVARFTGAKDAERVCETVHTAVLLSLVGGAVLAVSQFTLLGDARHGRRPSFSNAARPEEANALYEAFCQALRAENIRVETGVFQTDMQVELVNDGPVTILLDSRKGF